MQKEKAIVFWSGGKDAALALYNIFKENKYEVVSLVTTLNLNYKRSSMHGVREELMDEQAKRIGIPLHKMWVAEGSYQEYEEKLIEIVKSYADNGITKVVFGDIFLEDLKKYRDDLLCKAGATGVYPLWGKDTNQLLEEGFKLGFKTIICSVNSKFLPRDITGKTLSKDLLFSYPKVDPCGENGEYHTFVVDAPYFSSAIRYSIGKKIFKPIILSGKEKLGFWFCDIVC